MRSEAHLVLLAPDTLAARLIDHLAEHEIEFVTRDGVTVADLGEGTATLAVHPGRLEIGVEGRDLGSLEMLRSVIASHLLEFADEPLTIRWSGATSGSLFANFREVGVKAVVDLTPHMRRLTLTGPDIARFASDADIHVRTYFPPAGLETPEWPCLGDDGCTVWPEDERRPDLRYYTIRRVDLVRREIDIDFVMHATAGPGSDFAARAVPGAILGIAGPVGRTVGKAAWHLIAGDETALPAIARILETMADDARGAVFVEIDGPEDEIALSIPPGIAFRWQHRANAAPGASDCLSTAIRDVAWPDHNDVFVWVGCEFDLAKTIRTFVETERNVPRHKHLIVGYWHR